MLHARHAQLPLAHQPPVDHPAQLGAHLCAWRQRHVISCMLSSGLQGACPSFTQPETENEWEDQVNWDELERETVDW